MSPTRSISPLEPATDGIASTQAWQDAALLLLGLGSLRDAGAERTLLRHAAALRDTDLFGEVHAAVLRGQPALADVLPKIERPAIYVVPHAMCEGVVTRRVMRKALGLDGSTAPRRNAEGVAQRLSYCAPSGAHAKLAGVVCRRLLQACASHALAPAETGVLLIGHGTPCDEASRVATRRQADRLAVDNRFAGVATGFLMGESSVADALSTLGRLPVVVIGMFAAEGGHAMADVPELLAAARSEQTRLGEATAPLIYAGAIGADPELPALIVAQVAAFDATQRTLRTNAPGESHSEWATA